MTCHPSPWESQTLTGLALATTEVDPRAAELCGYAFVALSGSGQVTGQYADVVATSGPIPDEAARIHEITTAMGRSPWAQRPEDASRHLATALSSLTTPLVVFNAPWAFSVLNAHASRHGIAAVTPSAPLIDPLVLDHRCQHRAVSGNRTLPAVRGRWNLPPVAYGPPAPNAYAAVQLASTMIQMHPRLRSSTPQELAQQCAQVHDATERDFQQYRRREGLAPRGSEPWPVPTLAPAQ